MRFIGWAVCISILGSAVAAQTLSRETQVRTPQGEVLSLGVFCDREENFENDLCIGLIGASPRPITNFVPLLGGLGALLGAFAIGGAGGGGTPSTTTPSTTQ